MSEREAQRLIADLEADETLRRELENLANNGTPEQVHECVVNNGYDASPEEIREAFLEAFGSQLDEDQLAAIAGGISSSDAGNIAMGTLVGVGVVAGASAAAAAI